MTNLRMTKIADQHGRSAYEASVDLDADLRGSVQFNLITWDGTGMPVHAHQIVTAKPGTNSVQFNPIPEWALQQKPALLNVRVGNGQPIGIALTFGDVGQVNG
jgi:hypothetical protein